MLACITHQLRRGVEAHRLAVEQRGQKGVGVVALQPRADIDQQRKAGRVALWEAVFAEALDLLEDALGVIRLVTLGHHAADQPFMERTEAALALPRGHRAAQAVGFTGREIGRQDRQLHHLLLKDRHAQRAAQRPFDLRLGVVDRLLARTAAQVGVHHAALDRAGPHDGHLDHQVVEAARPQARQHVHLGPALDLKGADRIAPAQHVVDRRVVARHVLHRERPPVAALGRFSRGQRTRLGLARPPQLGAHHRQRTADGAEHAQRQDVDLDQPQRVEVVLVPLDHGALVHRGVFHRHQARDVVARDDEAARVLAEVARKADQLLGERHPLTADQRIGVEPLLAQAVGRDGLAVEPVLALGHRVDAVEIEPERPADVAQRGARPVADHHAGQRGPVAAVLAVDVLDHLFAALVLEIDVDVGRLVALGRDEALEQQAGLGRVDLGDAQAVADHRIGRAAATLAEDALGARPLHDVGHGEEVGLEPQLPDQRQLVLDRLAHRWRFTFRVTAARAGFGQRAQPAGGRLAGGHDLFGVFITQLGQRKATRRGDGQRSGQPLGRVQPGQALARAQVGLGIGRQLKTAIGHRPADAGGGHRILQRLA